MNRCIFISHKLPQCGDKIQEKSEFLFVNKKLCWCERKLDSNDLSSQTVVFLGRTLLSVQLIH
jgi:hypothetical protein